MLRPTPACLCLLALPLAIPSLAAQSLIQRPTQVPLEQLQPEAFRQRIAGSTHHVLVVVLGRDAAWNRRMEALIADPEVQALDLWVVRLAPASPLAQGLAAERALTGPGWLLYDASPRLLLQESQVPADPPALLARLLQAGARNPVAALDAYLQRHPDHVDARAQRITLRLKQAQAWFRPRLDAQGRLARPLTAAEEARQVVPLVRDLEGLLRLPGGLRALPRIDWLDGLPAEGTPALAAMARRVRPLLESHVQRTYEHPALDLLVCCHLWTGEGDLAGFMESLEPVPSTGGVDRFYQPRHVLRLFAAQARRTGRWEAILPFLTRTVDGLLGSANLFGPPPTVDQAWEEHGVGLLMEALLRLDRERDATTLLQAFLAWQPGSPLKASALALRCGHPTLARQWSTLASTASPSQGDAPQARPQQDLAGFLRKIQDTPATVVLLRDERREEYDTLINHRSDPRFARWGTGMALIPHDSAVAQALQKREGWTPGPRWALFLASGRVVATGATLPATEVLIAHLASEGVAPLPDRLRAFLQRHPDHAIALSNQMYLDRHALRNTPGPRTEAQENALWEPVLAGLRHIAAQADTLTQRSIQLNRPEDVVDQPRLKGIAPSLLPPLEAALRRAPFSGRALWSTWMEVKIAANQDPGPFIHSLEPWPGGLEVPDFITWTQLTSLLVHAQRWPQLERLLTPLWQRIQESRERAPQAHLLWRHPVSGLLQAHLRQGHLFEAEALMDQVQAVTNQGASWAEAAALARTCGVESLAQRWAAKEPK